MRAILIVDDEKMTLNLISGIVSNLGYFPILATNGQKVMSLLEDNPHIAGVMTDYQMPIMDGIEVIEQIREHPKFSNMPIMIFSAYIKLKEIGMVLDKGASAFMPKPITKINIQEFLERHVG